MVRLKPVCDVRMGGLIRVSITMQNIGYQSFCVGVIRELQLNSVSVILRVSNICYFIFLVNTKTLVSLQKRVKRMLLDFKDFQKVSYLQAPVRV